jgi:hypothetical protein
MRCIRMVVLALFACSLSARAQVWDPTNAQCEARCRSTLDQCAAASNKIMETALKETSAYNVGSSSRQRADVKFENAFQTAENCWDKYYVCAGKCRAPRKCVEACQATFRQCFAAGESKVKEGLRAMRHAKFGSPEWQAAYAKGDAETDRCLQEDQSCQVRCVTP